MTINHHLDEATILAHAAGTLGEAHGFAAATHLAYCPACRAAVAEAEVLGGEIMMQQDDEAVSDRCRAATLASLDGMPAPSPRKVVAHGQGDLPAVLANVLGARSLEQVAWKKKAPGVASYEIPLSSGSVSRLQLLRIGSGRQMPEHGHGGEEITVILQGSYSDHTGQYRAGDVADLDEDMEHTPKVDSEVDCICLVATEAPTRFKSFWARLAQPLIGI